MHGLRTSQVLTQMLEREPATRITVADVMARLGDRSYGMLLIILAIANLIPGLPGLSIVLGLALSLVGGQLLTGRRVPWLPERVRALGFSVERIRPAINRTAGALRSIEKMCRPRLESLTSASAERIVGLLIVVLALVIALPIPFLGNLPPALAIATLATGMMERDGVAVLAGMALTAVAIAVSGGAALAAAIGAAKAFPVLFG
jgi:hypothetical protein